MSEPVQRNMVQRLDGRMVNLGDGVQLPDAALLGQVRHITR